MEDFISGKNISSINLESLLKSQVNRKNILFMSNERSNLNTSRRMNLTQFVFPDGHIEYE